MNVALNEMHVWLVCDEEFNDPQFLKYCHSVLNNEEAKQQQRFHFERNRHQYLITRAVLRIILSKYERSVRPQDWLFTKSEFGKPYLDPIQSSLFFNLSHTHGMITIAISLQDYIGIDIEFTNRADRNISTISNIFTPSEVEQLHKLPTSERNDYFFRIWTMKEAYAKAIGRGLSSSLNDLIYHPHEINNVPNWQFWECSFDNQYQVALAARNHSNENYERVKMYKFAGLECIEVMSNSINPVRNLSLVTAL